MVVSFFYIHLVTFSYIYSLVRSELKSIKVPGLAKLFGRIIPVDKQVEIVLRRLATVMCIYR